MARSLLAVRWADVRFAHWPVDPAAVAANGFDRPEGEPRGRYGPRLDVTAGRIRRP